MGSLNGYFALVVDILKQRGLSSKQALLAFPITYGIGLVARMIPGIAKQFKGVSCFVIPILLNICGIVGQIVIINSPPVAAILVGCGISGLTISGVASSINIIVVQTVNDDQVSVGLGLAYSSVGVFSAVSGPTYGLIKDASHSYDVVQYLTAGCQFLGILLFLFARSKRRKLKLQRETSVQGVDNYAMENVTVTEYI